ncbi:MAG TPA: YcfL family protein [Kiritimatiellia bacterium]|nr:YcfL family protein [Kiritimatiellia bacterium]
MKTKWIAAGVLAVAASLWQGCATAGLQAGDSSYGSSPYLVADDPQLADQITIVTVSHDFVGDLMRAHVTMRSNRGRSLQIQYRFSWYDANGMEIDPASRPYRDVTLQGRDTVSVNSVAPSPHAAEFKIRVRKVKLFKIENIR